MANLRRSLRGSMVLFLAGVGLAAFSIAGLSERADPPLLTTATIGPAVAPMVVPSPPILSLRPMLASSEELQEEKPTTYACVGSPIELFDNMNRDPAKGGGLPPTFSTGGTKYCLHSIRTYHYSHSTPGTIGLQRSDSTMVGPWPAVADLNKYHTATPDTRRPVIIDGTYDVIDSDRFTWAQNPTSGGKGFAQVYVLQAVPPPTVVWFNANIATITAGNSSMLSWSTLYADTVSIDNGIGQVPVNGTYWVSPSVTTTYTLTATNAAGSTTPKGKTITVNPVPPVSYFHASPDTITAGQTSFLSWQTSGMNTVSIDHGIGNVALSGGYTVSPTATTTYTLTATNAAGSTTRSVTVTVNPPAPPPPPSVAYFYPPPVVATITAGQTSMLYWSTINADTVSIDHGIGNVGLSGWMVVSPAVTTTYTLTATNTVGSATRSTTITVNPASPPSVAYFYPAPPTATITVGQTANLVWSTSGANTVSIDHGMGNVAASGWRSVSPAITTTYTLTATNAAGSTTRSTTVTVNPSIASFYPSPASITAGQTTKLVWLTSGASTVSIDNGIGNVALSGWMVVSPANSTTYTLTATNPSGSATRSTMVTVNPAPPP